MTVTLPVPSTFNFLSTIYSHGWYSLLPFEVQRDKTQLRRLFALSSGAIIDATIQQPSKRCLKVETHQAKALSLKHKQELLDQVRSCLRLDENYAEFYREATTLRQYRWIPKVGAGRMLRAPTVFEDIVKMICTTNCSWALTEIMVNNLCAKLGHRVTEASYSFPSAEDIAASTEKFLRKEIRAGYRAPYLLELSRRISTDELNIESWRATTLPTEELFDEVRSIKGVGPYAAGNILKLLGRYDYLGIDSWCRKKFFELHHKGRKVSDRAIEKYYAPFGKWKGLFFWLDVTKHWYEQQSPLRDSGLLE